MLFLLFHLGPDRYALDAAQIIEVLPLVSVKLIPLTPPSVAGVFNYRGAPVPLIDLSQLALNRPAPQRLSTRIILVNHPDGAGGMRPLGLIAERVTETMRCEPGAFVPSGIHDPGTPYLGPVVTDQRGLIQRVEVGQLLPPPLRELLFSQPEAR